MDDQTKKNLNHIAAMPEGQDFLNWLMQSCGWEKTVLSSDNPQATQYWAARRGVYGGIRQHIDKKHLKVIEFIERKAEKNDSRKSKPRPAKPSARAKSSV